MKALCAVVSAIIVFAWAASAQDGSFSERDPRYRLQPSDVLEIHYRYTPEFDQSVAVQPDGFVRLQIVGDLKLQGMSIDQATAAILEKARAASAGTRTYDRPSKISKNPTSWSAAKFTARAGSRYGDP